MDTVVPRRTHDWQAPVWCPQRNPLQAMLLIKNCPKLVTHRMTQQALAVARKPWFPCGTQHHTCRLSLITWRKWRAVRKGRGKTKAKTKTAMPSSMGIRDKSGVDWLASSTKVTWVLTASDEKIGENWTEMTPICRVLELCPRKALGSDIRFSCSGPQSTLWFGSLWFPRPLTFASWCLPCPSTPLTHCNPVWARCSEAAAQGNSSGLQTWLCTTFSWRVS